VKPSPAGKSSEYVYDAPSSWGIPTSPATAPESTIEATTIFRTSTPLATAAASFMPVARRSNPKRVRLTTNQKATPTITASTTRPYTLSGVPGISGNPPTCPDSGIGLVPRLLEPCVVTASRPGASR